MTTRLRIAVCLLSTLVVLAASTRPAFACSGGGGDPVVMSEVIVGGWITNWKPANSGSTGQVEPVTIQMSVDRVFKGRHSRQSVLQFVNYHMLDYSHQEIMWGSGQEGSCSAFESDPKGKYVIIGLVKDETGQYRTDLFYRFYVGDHPPSSDAYATNSGLVKLIPLLPISGGENRSPSWILLIVGSISLLAGILIRHGEDKA